MNTDQLTHNDDMPEKTRDEIAEAVESLEEAETEQEPLSPEEQLVQAQAQADEYLDGWQRARAELANYKKRVERERTEMYESSRLSVISRFLDVLDDFHRALENAPEKLDDDDWFQGLTLIQRKFGSLFESEGVSEINPTGQMFDPMLHEAITQETSEDHNEGEIIEVVQKGYMLGERVVRPAKVRVAG